ncbi:MAG: hypothetical protein E6J90_27925 [Deltaproteobacteria bacterium]|nr:MAG: hypothetical protein E6J90_27925 [Deltaproteobacteria bacterium]TMQ19890.1 MAG: hypothetical protein E6J91_04935 [Deltaproteobacteria bacterium]
MRGRSIIGLAAALALVACNAPQARPSQDDPRPVPPRSGKAPAPDKPPEPRRAAVVALAVDQSASMRGFAATGSMAALITNADQAIRDVTQGSATYYSLDEAAERVPEERLLDRARYTKAAADLRVVLDSPELRDADVLVAFTDGQPTSAHGQLGICTPAGTQVISDLEGWFATYVKAGMAAWIVLDKLPFAGRFFLNCRDADKVPEIKSRLGRKLECDRRECSYMIPESQPQDRAVVGIVLARPPFADTASSFVQSYLRSRSSATAVRLHRSPRDRHEIDRVTASLVGAHATYPVDVHVEDGDAQTRAIHVHCPEGKPDMAVRVCVRLRAGDAPPGQSLARMDPPEIDGAQPVRDGRGLGDWLELPRGQSLDPAVMPQLHAARHDCASLWPEYLKRVKPERPAEAATSCTGGDGIEVHEVITACGCRPRSRHGATEVRFVQQYHSTAAAVERDLSTRGFSADPQAWFEQPDRVNGLSQLVRQLAAMPAGDAEPHVVLRLVIDVKRP